MHSRLSLLATTILIAALSPASEAAPTEIPSRAHAVVPSGAHAMDQVIVRFGSPTTLEQARRILDPERFEVVQALIPSLNVFLVKLKEEVAVASAVTMLRELPQVLYAQPDHYITLREVLPDDAEFAKQWSLLNATTPGADIGATEAWKLGTGGKDRGGNDIVVAIVDGGMETTHSDLTPNLWVNTGEIAGNMKDDDGNGYIDDINGWNALVQGGSGNIPGSSHGTHVAGIAGAKGNNKSQVTGINWNVKLMPVAGASRLTSVVAAAYGYVLAQKKLWIETQGAKGANVVVTNSSFGVDFGNCQSEEFRLWNDMYDAMGNVGILSAAATANRDLDIDSAGDVPTACSSEYVVSVTNTTNKDEKYLSAGYGLKTIDLGAPGTEILSAVTGNITGVKTGTSMATPHVAGAIAFMHSVASEEFHSLYVSSPAAAALELKALLLKSVKPLPSLQGKTVSGGRLSLAGAGQAALEFRKAER